jgi:hypothetical protein
VAPIVHLFILRPYHIVAFCLSPGRFETEMIPL